MLLILVLLFGTVNAQNVADCDFEENLCGYTATNDNNGNFIWSLMRSSSPSQHTGPFGDHYGNKNRSYLYTESSSPAEPNDVAELSSPEISESGPVCLSFWYNAHGEAMGKLRVETDQSGEKDTIFESVGNKGVKWINVKEDLAFANSFKISFKSVRGLSFTSDMAIDDIKLLPGKCPVKVEPTPPPASPIIGDVIVPDLCPIEAGYCVNADGKYPHRSVRQINSNEMDTESAQKACLEECRKDSEATACQVIWHQRNRGCYKHYDEIARGNGAGRHMCWVFSKCTDTVVKKICPRERGFCVREDGGDQNSGVYKLDGKDTYLESAKLECLRKCGKRGDATGCEVIWDQGNTGCYVHTQEIARGNNVDRHMCWIFSKCQEYNESTYVPPIQLAPIVPALIYGVKRIGCFKKKHNQFPGKTNMQRNTDPVSFVDRIKQCRDIVDSKGNDFEIFGVSDYGRECYYGSKDKIRVEPFEGKEADNCRYETIGGHDSLYVYKSCKDSKTCPGLSNEQHGIGKVDRESEVKAAIN